MQNDNSTTSLEIAESIEILIEAISLNPIAIGKLVALLSDKTFTVVQKIPYMQLKRYIDGVKKAEENLADGCKLSDKLFSDPKKRNENAMRVYKMVTTSDTEKKIAYLVDVTRSMLLGLIDVEMLFRVFRVVVESMPEDLEFLSSPYVGIGEYILSDNDDARRSAEWAGAVNTLEETGMLECVNRKDKIYKLTDEGWKQAEIYIEANDISEDDMKSPYSLLECL